MRSDPPAPPSLAGPDDVRFENRTACVKFGELTYVLRGVSAGVAAYLRVPVRVERGDKSHLDRVDLSAARARKRFAEAAAKKLAVDPARIDEHLIAILALLENRARDEIEKEARPVFAAPRLPTEEERRDALAVLRAPGILDRVGQDLEILGYVGESRAKRLVYLVSISRKLARPLAAILRSSPGSGKSALMELVSELAPPEDVVYLSELTPQALYYLEPGALKHKLVVVDERAGSERADYAIRTLLSRHTLTLAVTLSDAASGRRRTRLVEVEGPVAYLESTTEPLVNAENASRAIEVFLDESPEQTRRIQEAQRRERAGAGRQDRARLVELHRNVQRGLEAAGVVIPYATHLAFPSERPRHRRDHDKFLRLIETSALLHQHQRERRDGAIAATIDDYRIAYKLACGVIAHAAEEMTPAAREILALLRDRELLEFTRRDLCRALGWPPIKVWRTLGELVRGDFVVPLSAKNGVRRVYRVLEFYASGPVATRLLPPDELARRLTVS